jgi:hypothetical protein
MGLTLATSVIVWFTVAIPPPPATVSARTVPTSTAASASIVAMLFLDVSGAYLPHTATSARLASPSTTTNMPVFAPWETTSTAASASAAVRPFPTAIPAPPPPIVHHAITYSRFPKIELPASAA